MSKILAILGAGELGRQIANFAINDLHYLEVVFYDDFSTERNVMGKSDALIKDYSDNKFDELIIGIGYHHLQARKEKHEAFKNKIPFGRIVHSSSWVDNSASIGAGCIIYPKCTIDKNVTIDDNTILNLNCTIAHDTKIGSHSFLAPSVSVAGFCSIGEQCFLGTGTIISDSVTIISNIKSGAGTVIVKNLDQPGLYVGIPSKKIEKK
jgi:sugar O-acyltransferase (sialic acid O-acetyltransferase NeuD family)